MNSKAEMTTLTPESLNKLDAYWRAANYLSVGQMYLRDNPLLCEPLKLEHLDRQWNLWAVFLLGPVHK